MQLVSSNLLSKLRKNLLYLFVLYIPPSFPLLKPVTLSFYTCIAIPGHRTMSWGGGRDYEHGHMMGTHGHGDMWTWTCWHMVALVYGVKLDRDINSNAWVVQWGGMTLGWWDIDSNAWVQAIAWQWRDCCKKIPQSIRFHTIKSCVMLMLHATPYCNKGYSITL